MEVREQRAYRRAHRRTGVGEVVGPQLHGVLGDEQGHPEEALGQQSRQRGGAARRGMAEVDGAEALLVVPVEGERAQHPVELRGEGEEVGDGGGLDGASGAMGAAGGLKDPHRGLGAQGRGQPPVLAGQFGEPVEAFRELRVGDLRVRDPRVHDGRSAGGPAPACVLAGVVLLAARRTRHAHRGSERGEVGDEAPPFAPPVRAGAPAGQQPREQPSGGVEAEGVLVGGPQGRRPHAADLDRELDPALCLLLGAAAEREEIELVLREAAHQTVAPESGLTGRIRIATFGEQSDPHEHTPDLPCERPPLDRRLAAGRP